MSRSLLAPDSSPARSHLRPAQAPQRQREIERDTERKREREKERKREKKRGERHAWQRHSGRTPRAIRARQPRPPPIPSRPGRLPRSTAPRSPSPGRWTGTRFGVTEIHCSSHPPRSRADPPRTSKRTSERTGSRKADHGARAENRTALPVSPVLHRDGGVRRSIASSAGSAAPTPATALVLGATA